MKGTEHFKEIIKVILTKGQKKMNFSVPSMKPRRAP